MNQFLAIQNNYHSVQIALFDKQQLCAQRSIDKKEASKLLMPELASLLHDQHIHLTDLACIAVNQGPAPFTTLRVVLASMNGLSFASNIPLIGIDAFEAMYTEWHDTDYPNTVILFNAFAGELYFAIAQQKLIERGYQQVDALLQQCADLPGTIRFIGNGAELYRAKILDMLGDKAYLPEPIPAYCSINHVAQQAVTQWQQGDHISKQLLPLYLKKHAAQQS